MLDEFPQAFALVFVYDGNTALLGLFNRGAIFHIGPAFIALRQRTQFVLFIQVDTLVILCKIHEAVSVDMIDKQFIIEVNIVSIVLV